MNLSRRLDPLCPVLSGDSWGVGMSIGPGVILDGLSGSDTFIPINTPEIGASGGFGRIIMVKPRSYGQIGVKRMLTPSLHPLIQGH